MGYYEHEIEVKFAEGLLNSSREWQWFIDYTEGSIEPDADMESISDFGKCYHSIQSVFVHLARLVDAVGPLKVNITQNWLQRVYECVLVRSEHMDAEEAIKGSSFYDVLAVMSYATRLINRVSETRYLYNSQLLFMSNLFELFDFGPLESERDGFVNLAKSIDIPGFENAIDTLSANFTLTAKHVDESWVSELLNSLFDENFLSFKNAEGRQFQTWQESLLCDAFKVSFGNGTLEPIARSRNGSEYPDTHSWSIELLSKAKESFSDIRAVCVFETLLFCKHKVAPSDSTRSMLADLCLHHVKKLLAAGQGLCNISCTALAVVDELIQCKMLGKEQSAAYFKGMKETLSGVSDYTDICILKQYRIPCTAQQESIYAAETKAIAKNALGSIDSPADLLSFFGDERNAKGCDQCDIAHAIELLSTFSEKVNLLTASLFYSAMMFCIDALSNPQVDNKWLHEVMIGLRRAWQSNYYAPVLASMQTISYENSVPSGAVDDLNKSFLESPQSLTHNLILQSDEAIISTLESLSENVFTLLANKITISEYYPNCDHVAIKEDPNSIDFMIAEEVCRVYKENAFRFLNAMKRQDALDGFYGRLRQGIQMMIGFIDIRPAYEWIVQNAPEQYYLLPFPEDRVALGHLTQLFPLLENVIRQIGELFAIVPFKENKQKFTQLKDVSSVLARLVGEVEEITGTIQGCNEFLFTYFVMYSSNGFNVRNDCIHGRQYQDPVSCVGAFKLTVICLYMMLKRLRGLEAVSIEQRIDERDDS